MTLLRIAKKFFPILGVTGFDGCSEGLLACRGCLGPRYQIRQTTNGENNYAMAA